MELTPKTQIVELIKTAEKILILTHEDPDGDAIGSALALRLALLKLKKQPEAVIFGSINPVFGFLAGFSELKTNLLASNDLILTVDTRATGEDLALGYRKFPEEHRIKIVITPPKGTLLPEDVIIERSVPKYDLIIIVDCASLGLIGPISRDYPDLLYEIPTVALDHHPTNAHFAKVNWIDLTAASTSEMLVSLIESLGRDEPLLDKDIATSLLTGLIGDTSSFQNANTTPKSLTVAAQLVAAGADHQQIMEALRSRSLPTLKLWGKALSNIKEEPEGRFIWTSISAAEAQALNVPTSGGGLIDELLKTVGEVDFVLLLTEREGYVDGNLRSVDRDFDVSGLAKQFDGGGHKQAAGFRVEGTLEAERDGIIAKIHRSLQRQEAPIKVS